MTIADGIRWFEDQFGDQVRAAIAGTPFTLELIAAIAVQESFEVWGRAYKTHPVADVLRLSVGDTIDASGGRSAFPKSRAALEGVPNGRQMFAIAHQALVDMATVATEYARIAKNPNKFAHAFGIFQYDIQAFLTDRAFFLNREWADFGKCLAKCLAELEEKRRRVFRDKTALTYDDLVYVAIAYNKGSARVGAGFKQGFKSGGLYYGQLIDRYMKLAQQLNKAE